MAKRRLYVPDGFVARLKRSSDVGLFVLARIRFSRSEQDRPRFGQPALLPRRARRLPGAGTEPFERSRIGRKRLEEVEKDVGELPAVREQQAVIAVPDDLEDGVVADASTVQPQARASISDELSTSGTVR